MNKNDNRNYKFAVNSIAHREEYEKIIKWIPKGSKMIDLGCGDGSLLAMLKDKGIKGEGIEISESGVKATRKKGIKATVGRIDVELPYENKEFDYAICNVTLQMVIYPEILLQEMKRIAKYQIISFPNFAFLPNRLDLLFRGHMPQVMISGYRWYSTGHIHQLSIRDFKEFCAENNLKIIDQHHIFPRTLWLSIFVIPSFIMKYFPNAWSIIALYLIGGKR